MNISKLIEELKRRNVFKVVTAYAIAGWSVIQIATSVFPAFNFPDWTQQFVIILTAIGFPISLIIAWAFELTPQGLKTTKEVDEKDEAHQLIKEMDENKELHYLKAWLYYQYFDYTLYPNLNAMLEAENHTWGPVIEIPFRCGR